jgi:hypothetical protein
MQPYTALANPGGSLRWSCRRWGYNDPLHLDRHQAHVRRGTDARLLIHLHREHPREIIRVTADTVNLIADLCRYRLHEPCDGVNHLQSH